MAKKISQLTQATEVKSDDVTVIVQDGETKKLPLNMMVTKQDIENKKVAGLAKLDEIEATYENDTYTPTITVKNKSSVKTGEGDEVDYSANVMDGHAKSAILKGQTLVNALQEPQNFRIYGEDTISYYYRTYKTPTLKANTKYYYKVLNMPTNANWVLADSSSTTNVYFAYGSVKNTSGTITLNNNVASSSKLWIRFLNSETSTVDVLNKIQIIFLEYQDGMENWDIPYFTDMQSVKLPVLKTTGKNLFPKGISEFSETSLKSTTVNEDVVTIKFNDTNGRIAYRLNKKDFDVTRDIYIFADVNLSEVYTQNTSVYAMFCRQQGMGSVYNSIKIATTGWQRLRLHIPSNVIKDDFDILFYKSASIVGHTPTLQVKNISIQYIDNGSYEPYKSNILSTSEDVVLRGIGDVRDTLDCLTGEVTERIGEIVLDGSENWIGNANFPETNDYKLMQIDLSVPIINATDTNILSDKIRVTNYSAFNSKEYEFVSAGKTGATNVLFVKLNKSKLISADKNGFNDYFSKNPTTVYFTLLQNSVKTVDLMPSGTHPSTTPYCWKNGHIQLSSSGLLPNLEYSVVTSRAGQINQNATMIVKNDKRIFDLEILLAGGLVNTTYQALTLQNQVETGLSKVSLNSETEPDYLLYHMIMKLIEEKAYKLDDLTEKVSVFYLYEKLSDEQFETIYSALYPFVEDEIVEEPVVEELPEVAEDEVIM